MHTASDYRCTQCLYSKRVWSYVWRLSKITLFLVSFDYNLSL